jgi:hypothetical protein
MRSASGKTVDEPAITTSPDTASGAYIDIGSSDDAGSAGSSGAAVDSVDSPAGSAGAGVWMVPPPQAANTKLANTKAANKTYKFLRIFSLLLIEFFICCHVIKLVLKAMEEPVNVWLTKKS